MKYPMKDAVLSVGGKEIEAWYFDEYKTPLDKIDFTSNAQLKMYALGAMFDQTDRLHPDQSFTGEGGPFWDQCYPDFIGDFHFAQIMSVTERGTEAHRQIEDYFKWHTLHETLVAGGDLMQHCSNQLPEADYREIEERVWVRMWERMDKLTEAALLGGTDAGPFVEHDLTGSASRITIAKMIEP